MSLCLEFVLRLFYINCQARSRKKCEKFLLLVYIQMDQMDAGRKLQVNAFEGHSHHSNISNCLSKNQCDDYE